jgi:hypothetical protein
MSIQDKVEKYLTEGPYIKTGAVKMDKPKPGLLTVHTAMGLYDLYHKIEPRVMRAKGMEGEDAPVLLSTVLNYIFLAHEALRKKWPDFFKKLK